MSDSHRPRLRDIGFKPGHFATGLLNAITDVEGVSVGHATVIEGDTIRTGATAILPHSGNLFQDKVPAALAVYNGFGKFTGSTQIEELGELETPVILTNTLATGRAIEAINRYTIAQPGNEKVVLPLKWRSFVWCGRTGKRGSFTSVSNSRYEPYHQALSLLT